MKSLAESADPETRALRAKLAQEVFKSFDPSTRKILLKAASRSPMVFRRLGSGTWPSLVKALRGLGIRSKKDPGFCNELKDIIAKIELGAPHGLEG